jgi:hypothetical protein
MSLSRAEISVYRSALQDVNALLQRVLRSFWAGVDPEKAIAARNDLEDFLPDVLVDYHQAAAAVAADWYDLNRTGRGKFDAIMPEPPEPERAEILARWAVSPLFSAQPDSDAALSKLGMASQRLVLDGARDTIMVSSVKDPSKPGWIRIGTGDCDFCKERLGQRTTTSTIFDSHDGCGCGAVPGF